MKVSDTAVIAKFILRHAPHPGVSCEPSETEYPATRAALALALDRRDYDSLSNVGSWGNIGCGSTDVWAVIADGEMIVDDDDCENAISEERAEALLTADGTIDPDTVHALREEVWDGNNHVLFIPSRALACLTKEDRWERIGHALVRWDEDGFPADMRIDEGWTVFDEYLEDWGNEPWTHDGIDSEEDIETPLEAGGIKYSTVNLGPRDVVILIQQNEMDAAEKALTQAEVEKIGDA